MTRLTAELVASLTDRVSGPARNIGRSMDHLQRKQRQSDVATSRTGRMAAASMASANRASDFALAGAARVLAPVAGGMAIKEVITQAADFESALTNIQKKAGISTAETAKLGEEIKALATSGELAVPIAEIAAAYERGAAAGIPLQELREFSSLSAKAADAFEMSATDVGNAAAGFSTVLKIPMNEMERYFDLINGLADSGIADESEIVTYVDQAGAMAKTFGLSAEQTAAFGATLANLKIQASKGATATNTIFARLLAPQSLSDAGRAAYDALIKDDKKFQKQLAEGKADEAFLSMVDALEELDASTRTGLLVDLFGREHMDTMLQLVEGSKELRRNMTYAGQTEWFGSLNKSYQLKLDDFWSKWQLMKNDLSTLAIDLGDMGMPALEAGMEGVVYLVRELQKGMDMLALEIDWTAVDAAKQAVGEMGTELGELLNIDTSGSSLEVFFSGLADAINDVSRAVKWVSKEVTDISNFMQDPVGEMTRERTPEELERAGITRVPPEELKRRQAEAAAKRDAENAPYAADRQRSMDDFMRGDGVATAVDRPEPVPASKSYDPWVSAPSLGLRIGPNTPDEESRRRADERWREIRADHAAAQVAADAVVPAPAAQPGSMRLPDLAYPSDVPRGAKLNPPLPTRRPAEEMVERMNVPAPTPAPRAAVAAPSPVDAAAIREIDQQLGALMDKKRQIEEGFEIAPSSSAAAAMRTIGDEMQRLMDRRMELVSALATPSAAVAPNIVQPLAEEGARAHSTALQLGSQIQTALSVTAAPRVDDSSIRAASGSVRALIADLQRIPGLARQAGNAAASARADYSGLHADLSRAG